MNGADRRLKKQRLSVHGVLFYMFGGLLLLTTLSVWLVCGMYAKYTVGDTASDSARVAAGLQMELKEHKAVLVDGIYYLKNGTNDKIEKAKGTEEVDKNFTYDTVIPGVDVPKDPFVRLTGTSEVDYYLYIEVIKSANFPRTVTYEIDTDKWEPVAGKDGVYKYKGIINSGEYTGDGLVVYILKDNKLTVSESFIGPAFNLEFVARIEQVD